jgi:hypothetical protein
MNIFNFIFALKTFPSSYRNLTLRSVNINMVQWSVCSSYEYQVAQLDTAKVQFTCNFNSHETRTTNSVRWHILWWASFWSSPSKWRVLISLNTSKPAHHNTQKWKCQYFQEFPFKTFYIHLCCKKLVNLYFHNVRLHGFIITLITLLLKFIHINDTPLY